MLPDIFSALEVHTMSTSGTPSAWDDPNLRQRAFDVRVQSPGAWIFSALDLKTAADRINWMDAPIRDEEPSLGLFHVYRMLIAMSIESLLKDIFISQGVNIMDMNGKLARDFTTHELSRLASKIDPKQFTFSADELRILKEMEPYIV